ncbi:hypothetical protein [Leptospira paudalimensis]|uniref:Uncharacterized protein n=1 Tax=Leptospira paudalimensis TaxID=2950024 RepID=A0ABT3M6A1_9LEPT|nr:hypothetical protein [Leptospira paudalimensis]MCW7503905.1 hypothetical protein [Leptospira paudalimensis]
MFLQTTKTLAELIDGLSWISTAERLKDFEIIDLRPIFEKFETLFQLAHGMLVIDPTLSLMGSHQNKVINLNGVDMGERVKETLLQLQNSIQDCISILSELESQNLIPFMEENLFSRFQTQYKEIHSLSKELWILFDSYEMVVI